MSTMLLWTELAIVTPVTSMPPVTIITPVSNMTPVTSITHVASMTHVTSMPPVTIITPVTSMPPVIIMTPVACMTPVTSMTPVAILTHVTSMTPVISMPSVAIMTPVTSRKPMTILTSATIMRPLTIITIKLLWSLWYWWWHSLYKRCSLHEVAFLDLIWIDKWHQLFPAHWKVGPAPVFGASQPLEPAEWLALLILKAGDVESNPGPQNRKLPPSALTTQTTTLNSTTHSHATTPHHNKKLLTLLQLNINSITNKHEELMLLVTELQPDIITIQETKLKKHNKTPQILTYSAIRTDRANGKGRGLLTYIKHNITFSDTKIPNFINTELQIIQLHITNNKIYTIANIYIPPRNTTSPDHATCDADITSCIQYITNLPNSIISGDINAHSPIWHSHTTDHRGDLIADLLGNSDHITLNTNTHTRLPFAANQQPTSPDITSITTNLYNRTHWEN